MSYRRLGLLLALPTVIGFSLSACGTEDDAAPGPGPVAGSGPSGGTAGSSETAGGGGKAGTGAEAGVDAQGGMAGSESGPGGAGGSAGDGLGGAAGDGNIAGDGNVAGAGGEGGEGSTQPPLPTCTGPVELVNFNTDPAGAMGKYLTPATGPVQQSVVSWNATEGVTAPGAGKLLATFGAYSEQAQLSLYFNHAKWLCQTKLRAKVKLISATDLSHINGIGFGINSGNSTTGNHYSQQFTSTTTWAMDTWYMVELPFATAGYKDPAGTLPDFTDVVGIGIQVQTKSTGTLPVETTLYVDDVWLE
jgi:hypothetical protein